MGCASVRNVQMSCSDWRMMDKFHNSCHNDSHQRICPTKHCIDIIMTTVASQITSLTVVYSIAYSDADQRKNRSSASLAIVRRIHRDRWNPHTKGPEYSGKLSHLMTSSWQENLPRMANSASWVHRRCPILLQKLVLTSTWAQIPAYSDGGHCLWHSLLINC